MPVDVYKGQRQDLDDPASSAFSITPDSTTDLAVTTRGLYIGGEGDVEVIMQDGQTVVFKALAAGVVHPLRVTRVKGAPNTTATDIIGLV